MSFFRTPAEASATVSCKDNAGTAGNESEVNRGLLELRKVIKPGTDQYEYALIDGIVSYLQKLEALVDRELADSSAEVNRTREVIVDALRIINDAGSKMKIAQTVGLMGALKVLDDFKANKQKYVGDMEKLGRSFGEVKITAATVGIWRDLADWLQELHDKTANAGKDFKKDDQGFVKPLDDGTFPHTCIPDKIFKTSTGGISKYTLIYNYGVAAKLLRNVITNFEVEQAPRPALG